MISSIRHKQSISWTFSNDAMAISAKQMPKNHTDKERFAAASSCIEKGILTLLFPRKRRRSSPSPFISHRVLEAVASRILKSLIYPCDLVLYVIKIIPSLRIFPWQALGREFHKWNLERQKVGNSISGDKGDTYI